MTWITPLDKDTDPACGSGGMFVQSEKFVESHGGVAKCEVRLLK